MKLLVTGGAGFIGSHFIRQIITKKDVELVVNLDKLTYAGHLENLKDVENNVKYQFVQGDIADPKIVGKCIQGIDVVINFAAETHVDRSIQDASPFLRTNVQGTQVLLEAVKAAKTPRFVHISTDEVYGSIAKGHATEKTNLNPSSPYAASKAASDLLVMSYFTTFGLPVLITRAANNYGPFQYPEKFLPLFITRAMNGEPLPLYGDGKNVRDWLHVQDHCEAIEGVIRKGKNGQIYNIGGVKGYANIDVVQKILKKLDKPKSLVRFVTDRLGHDRRYAMSIAKITKELGWKPKHHFEAGLIELIHWYQANEGWWRAITQKSAAYKTYVQKQYGKATA